MDISFNVGGQWVIDNIKTCKSRIKPIKKYLSQQIFGINGQSVNIQRSYVDDGVNGLKLQIHIVYIQDKSSINPAQEYQDKLINAIDEGSFANLIQQTWTLKETPIIGNIQCEFTKSKSKKQLSLARRSGKEGEEEDDELRLQDTEMMKQRSIEMMQNIDIENSPLKQ